MNLLKPAVATGKYNEVNVTNNGDNTYVLNGTAVSEYGLILVSAPLSKGKYKNIGINLWVKKSDGTWLFTVDTNEVFEITQDNCVVQPVVYMQTGTVYNNKVIKIMVTSNLQATLDDFVPYTGNTGHINSDLAAILKRVEALETMQKSN